MFSGCFVRHILLFPNIYINSMPICRLLTRAHIAHKHSDKNKKTHKRFQAQYTLKSKWISKNIYTMHNKNRNKLMESRRRRRKNTRRRNLCIVFLCARASALSENMNKKEDETKQNLVRTIKRTSLSFCCRCRRYDIFVIVAAMTNRKKMFRKKMKWKHILFSMVCCYVLWWIPPVDSIQNISARCAHTKFHIYANFLFSIHMIAIPCSSFDRRHSRIRCVAQRSMHASL